MSDLLVDLDFKSFLDDTWGVIRDTNRLLDEFGWYKGDAFRRWIGKRIEAKAGNPHATFNDFHHLGFKDLYLMVTNVSTGYSEVMSYEHTPRMPVADAVRMSMSIPLFFRAIRSPRRDVYVDGGVLKNFPIKLFDREKYIDEADRAKYARQTTYYKGDNQRKPKSSSPYVYNKQTLGFRLDTKEEIALFRDGAEPPTTYVGDFFDYGWALVKTLLNAQENQHLHGDDWYRTIYIDTLDVGTTDFDMSNAKKRKLIKEGEKAVVEYFDWWDNAKGKELPYNHPNSKTKPAAG